MAINRRFLFSRRELLGSLAVAGVSPLFAKKAYAQGTTPKRFIVMHMPEGLWGGAQRASANGNGINLGPLLEPMAAVQDKLLVLNGLRIATQNSGPGARPLDDGHHRNVPHMLTGRVLAGDGINSLGPSIDQFIAKSIGTTTKFQSLQYGIRIVYGDQNSALIWGDAGRRLQPMQNPQDAFTRVFAGVAGGTTPTTPAYSAKKSILDHSLAEIQALNAQLAPSDRARLESYQDSLRDIERRLEAAPGSSPATCSVPGAPGNVSTADANRVQAGRLTMDMMVAAMQCDLTRVASLQWGNSVDQCNYSFIGANAIGHDLSHDESALSTSRKVTRFRWYTEQMTYLMQKLASVPEAGGTMLDNTVVLFAYEFGNSNGHDGSNLMWLLGGNVGGQFRTGRFLNFNNRSVNDLHTSLANAYGISLDKFGDPNFCAGPLSLS